MHIFPNISRSTGNQSEMKFGQLIRYKVRDIFFKNHAEIEAGRLVLDPFLFLKNFYMKKKERVANLTSIYFDSSRLGHTLKANYNTSECWCWDVLSFHFLKRGLGLVFSVYFVQVFHEKYLLCFTPLLEIFGNMYIIINCFPVCDIWKFETNLSFLIMSFFYVTQTIRTKF